MVNLYTDSPSAGRHPITLGPAIGQGLSGTVYKLLGADDTIVKLYKEASDLPEYREKVAAMLRAPPNLTPFELNGRTYVQIAWPTAAVVDGRGAFYGFAMPFIDTKAATELENILYKSSRRRKSLPEFYGARVLLAANLAALMTELHAQGHYMVDMKPLNTMFYPHAWYMAILDTDGFSIGGPKRFAAHQYSDEYIAPEAHGKPAEQLGLEQDLFALAVIIFRLLNNGVHPYSGVDRGGRNQPTSLQERIFSGLYAYGLAPTKAVGPALASIHEYFEDQTRRMFDRAFQQNAPRPGATEWRDHLFGLINNKALVRCAANAQDHAHFSKGCGLCAAEKTNATVIATAVRQRATQSSGAVLGRLSTAPRVHSAQMVRATTPAVSYQAPRSGNASRFALITIIAIVGFFFIMALSNGNRNNNSTAVPPPKDVTIPTRADPPVRVDPPIRSDPPQATIAPPVKVDPPARFEPLPTRKCVIFNNRQVCE